MGPRASNWTDAVRSATVCFRTPGISPSLNELYAGIGLSAFYLVLTWEPSVRDHERVGEDVGYAGPKKPAR